MRILIGFIFVMMVNVLLFSNQAALTEIAAEEGIGAPQIYTYEGSVIQQYGGNNSLDEDISGALPSGEAQVEATSGTYLTDTFNTFRGWLLSAPGLKYILAWVNAFPAFLKQIGLPVALAYVLGVFWHAIGVFLFVLLLRGNV